MKWKCFESQQLWFPSCFDTPGILSMLWFFWKTKQANFIRISFHVLFSIFVWFFILATMGKHPSGLAALHHPEGPKGGRRETFLACRPDVLLDLRVLDRVAWFDLWNLVLECSVQRLRPVYRSSSSFFGLDDGEQRASDSDLLFRASFNHACCFERFDVFAACLCLLSFL